MYRSGYILLNIETTNKVLGPSLGVEKKWHVFRKVMINYLLNSLQKNENMRVPKWWMIWFPPGICGSTLIPFFNVCIYSDRLHRKHIYIYYHRLLLDKQAFLWKSQFGPLLNMVVWGRLTSGFGARPDELGIWVWNGEIPNSLRQSQTRSLKKYIMFISP